MPLPLNSPISFLTPTCAVDCVTFAPDTMDAHFEITGTQTTTDAFRTVNGTMSGTADTSWSRQRGFFDIQNRNSIPNNDFQALRFVCDQFPLFFIGNNEPPVGADGFVDLVDMATISCTCIPIGGTCAGYPTSGTFSVFGNIDIQRTTDDFTFPALYKISVDFLLDSNPGGGSPAACAFLQSSVTHFVGETDPMTLADLASGSHVITVTLVNGTATATTTLEVTITFS